MYNYRTLEVIVDDIDDHPPKFNRQRVSKQGFVLYLFTFKNKTVLYFNRSFGTTLFTLIFFLKNSVPLTMEVLEEVTIGNKIGMVSI